MAGNSPPGGASGLVEQTRNDHIDIHILWIGVRRHLEEYSHSVQAGLHLSVLGLYTASERTRELEDRKAQLSS